MTATVSPARPSAGDLVDRALPPVLDVVREHAERTDQDAEFPIATLDALRDSGLLALLVPAEAGGPGGTLAEVLRASEALSRECMSVGMIFAMHCQQVAAVVAAAGPRLRAGLLPRLATGRHYLASVTTEAGKGGHLLSSGTASTAEGDRLHLDRFAPVVTGGAYADGFLVTMLAPEATSPNQVSLVYADAGQLELSVAGGWRPLGMRATHSVPMRLAGQVPADQVVGEPGAFRTIATTVFAPYAHLGWSACWLGAASGALARTVRLFRDPAERGRRDLASELLRLRLSRARQRLDLVHAMLWHTAGVYSAPGTEVTAPPVQLLLNALKLTASEQCLAAVDELVELTGLRHGYLCDSPLWLERTLRDLRSASLNYANDRLHLADGSLVLLDPEVRLA